MGLKFLQVSKELAEQHYGVHRERPFFPSLVEFITSGPVVAMVWEGDGVIASARKIIGATNPLTAEPGTIRGDFGINIGRNLIHGSDAPETAQKEVSLWFTDAELVNWQPHLTPWLHE
ncbi:nucleoside diphosphate kinase [Nostoc sp. PCC 7120 = FACHB-418]|nr:nucleoside diphoshpate kinase [Nostoc sp. PCC 7120 = FACHB-418]BAB75101.1 nucleoside diphosphate kinase [Nostoc sp. PCC 7120 = FACHB-418]